ncbi:hypothetical protein BH23ACT5_BH23ACT5_18460 [soil metagenome]
MGGYFESTGVHGRRANPPRMAPNLAPTEQHWVAVSRYRDIMTCMAKQTTVRLPEDLAEDAEAVARVKGTSVNALIIDALAAEIERVRQDEDFTSRAKLVLERDRELLERLAR